uniref:Mitochondrial import receptor subunit TOM22 homolog n=1 Tax=Rhabditophanes sp. KR3021 TaxID=114890 RepID=A0AC35TG78_9BILA
MKIDWDNVPDSDLTESLTERLVGLTEFLPPWVSRAGTCTINATKALANASFYYGTNAIWVLSTTFVIIVLPYAVSKELHDLEVSEAKQRKEMLLGPQGKKALV